MCVPSFYVQLGFSKSLKHASCHRHDFSLPTQYEYHCNTITVSHYLLCDTIITSPQHAKLLGPNLLCWSLHQNLRQQRSRLISGMDLEGHTTHSLCANGLLIDWKFMYSRTPLRGTTFEGNPRLRETLSGPSKLIPIRGTLISEDRYSWIRYCTC